MGKGVLDAADEHFLFTAGLRGRTTRRLLGRADLVVSVGYDMSSGRRPPGTPTAQRIVCIDTVPPEIDAHFVPEVELIGDLSRILFQLRRPARGQAGREHRDAALPAGVPPRARRRHRRRLPDQAAARAARPARADGAATTSSSATSARTSSGWRASGRRDEPNTVLISNGFAAMGFGLPATIAAALALRGRARSSCISGDGGFLMNVQELETARRLGLPVRGPGLERRRLRPHRDAPAAQVRAHRRARASTTPTCVALARSFGRGGAARREGRRRQATPRAGPAPPGTRCPRRSDRLRRERQAGGRPLATRPEALA